MRAHTIAPLQCDDALHAKQRRNPAARRPVEDEQSTPGDGQIPAAGALTELKGTRFSSRATVRVVLTIAAPPQRKHRRHLQRHLLTEYSTSCENMVYRPTKRT